MKLLHLFLFLILTGIVQAQNSPTLAQANAFIDQQKSAFEENKGQVWDTENNIALEVKYHFKKKGIDIFMLPKGLAYQFTKVHYPKGYKANLKKNLSPEEKAAQKALRAKIRTETYRMDMELINANPNASIITEGKSEDYVQYYNRNALDVYSFEQLRYQDVYPGIDWVIYTTEKGLKYDFIVQPGADPSQIQLKYTHHEDLKINADGSFTLSNRMGSVTEQAPVSFQEGQDIQTAFKLDGDIISFDLSNYDKTKVLTIDPSLLWATYYGGTYMDFGYSCTVDGSGNIYFSGEAESFINIASGGHQNTSGNYPDAFLAKFTPAGVRLWATYYGGGNGGFTSGYSCAVDGAGNVYLSGDTDSGVNISFNGHQNNYGGGLGNYEDAFLVKFNSAGVRQWATYYGGTGPDYGYSCAVDASGDVYLAGRTASSTNIAFGSNTFTGGAYIVKFSSAGVRLWATYYGGNNNTEGNSCAVDAMGNVYLSGWTASTSDVSSNGYQNTYGGGNHDAFLVKFNSTGVRQWASYYGGALSDQGRACTVDGAGNIYLTGSTQSTTNISSNGHQNTLGGSSDAFLVKFDATGARLWASYYGGTSGDRGSSCAVDASGNIFLAGTTGSTSGIAMGGHQNTLGGYEDAFIAKFNATGVRQWATYYGMSNLDGAASCAVDATGNVYFIGTTESTTNMAFNGHQSSFGGWIDAYFGKLAGSNCPATTGTDLQTACGSYTWIDGNTYSNSNNTATFTLTNAAGCDSIVTLDLTINSSPTGTDNQIACNSYTWIDGITYTTNNSSATDTLTSANGCDSIVTLNLIINNSNTGTDTQTACNSYTWIDGNTYTSSNNTATFTLTNVNGCDSVVTLDLTINNSNTGTDTQTACNSYTWIDGNTYTSSNNTATFTLTNGNGCDSVVTLDLTINNSNTGTDTQTACNSFTWIDGNTYTSSNNSATFTLTNGNGCDSVVTLDLTINNSNTGTDTQTACNSFTWIDGNTYTSSNNSATFTLTNSNGCDSVVTLDLTINTIDTTTSITGTTISANTTGATYQWLDCATNFTPINNATTQSFTPSQNGDYAVVITQNGCVDTSSCHTIIVVGINDLVTNNDITIYPNPTTKNIQIDFGKVEQNLSINVYSTDGKLIQYHHQIQGGSYSLELPPTTGLYILEIKTAQGISHYKVIKE